VLNFIDIIIVKSDPIKNQSSIRANQLIQSLSKRYSIIGLGWNRKGKQTKTENVHNFLQLFNLRARYAYEKHGTIYLLAKVPFFWLWIFFKLCIYRPKAVHACDLSTVLPCYIYKILFRRKLVFDIVDRYSMVYTRKNENIFFRILYSLVNPLEEYFASRSDYLLVVSDKMLSTFRTKPGKCATIMNCCEDHMLSRKRTEGASFKLLFTGHINRGRGLETLLDIMNDLKDVQLVITGKNKEINLFHKIQKIPNIKYEGFLAYDSVLDLEASCDALIALYDLDLQSQYEYGMANKILESMMCGLPVITNISHEIIEETKCGMTVEYQKPEQIKNAIITMRDNPELRRRYGNNGRQAFLRKYNWKNMEEKLYRVYEDLLSL
jgi:glycosyltransferase involved in cell wall biosynthesis